MHSSDFRSDGACKSMVEAIKEAELNTSGEIRIHLESRWRKDPVARAVFLFNKLKMYDTKMRNGVLLYVAYKSRKFAIIGDSGINEKVSPDFWDSTLKKLGEDFSSENYIPGICTAVRSVGDNLKKYFPYEKDDVNEQTDEISFG